MLEGQGISFTLRNSINCPLATKTQNYRLRVYPQGQVTLRGPSQILQFHSLPLQCQRLSHLR